ncbi:MAG: helix-turn-helix transcriptional regulator [Syntrophomonadaceae bacterium]|jgi:AraC family transcriptional regulator|nr:helix-turn-helix transcriptional regulator [Syntrophomonadaceae bacterium]
MDKKLLQSVAEEMFGHENPELKNDCFLFSPRLKEMLHLFMNECQADQPGCSLMLESLAVETAVLLLREIHYKPPALPVQAPENRENNCIARAVEYITDNYQHKLSLNDLAAQTHYSTFHFLRLFKQYTGRTPFEYLLHVKIEKAKHLLKKTNYSIDDISYLSGFSSSSYFSQIFKKKTGISPSQYRLHQ